MRSEHKLNGGEQDALSRRWRAWVLWSRGEVDWWKKYARRHDRHNAKQAAIREGIRDHELGDNP